MQINEKWWLPRLGFGYSTVTIVEINKDLNIVTVVFQHGQKIKVRPDDLIPIPERATNMNECYVCGRPSENPYIIQGAKVCPACKNSGKGPMDDAKRDRRRDIALKALAAHARHCTELHALPAHVIRLLADLHHFCDATGMELCELTIAANSIHNQEMWPNTFISKELADQEKARRKDIEQKWRDDNISTLNSLDYPF